MTKELTGNEIKSTINDKFHELIISIENDLLVLPNAASDLVELMLGFLNTVFSQFLISLPNFSFDFFTESLSTIETCPLLVGLI